MLRICPRSRMRISTMSMRSRCIANQACSVLIAIIAAVGVSMTVAPEAQSRRSMKLVLASQIGWHVNMTTGGEICAMASEDVCGEGMQSDKGGGFAAVSSVAVSQRTGNIYVVDAVNSRVQELSPTGSFILMFGWDVNATKSRMPSSDQEERNVCTAVSRDICTAGARGPRAGQFNYPASVSVDPLTGDVYVAEVNPGHERVDKFSSSGRFIWMIGGRVNGRTGGNICAEREIEMTSVRCLAGTERLRGSSAHGAFKFSSRNGNEMVAGGPEDLLYVADDRRVQEFTSDGKWKREVTIPSPTATSVVALAVDVAGYLFVVTLPYEFGFVANVVHKLAPSGEEVAEFVIDAREAGATVTIHGLTIDANGLLAVIGGEEGLIEGDEKGRDLETYMLLGALYDGDSGKRISEFEVPVGNYGIAFNGSDELYVAATGDKEVLRYSPIPLDGLMTGALLCDGSDEDETSVVLRCLPG